MLACSPVLFEAGTQSLLGMGFMDTGSGYNSQNILPVHFGLPGTSAVDIEVTSLTKNGRISSRLPGVNPADHVGQTIKVKVDAEGRIVP